MDKDKQIIYFAVIAILIVIILPYIGLMPKFAIGDSEIPMSDLATLDANGSVENFQLVNTVNSTISLVYLNNSKTYASGKIVYLSDNSTSLLDSIPTFTEGQHTLTKYQFSSVTNNTQVRIQKGIKDFYNSIQTVTQNVSVPTYINQTMYVNRTTNVTVNQTVYVDKEVKVEPTFLEQYGLAGIVFIILGLIIIYLIYKRTR